MKTLQLTNVPFALPKRFAIEIDETDRKLAGPFTNPDHCLMATALRRRIPGLKSVNCGNSFSVIGDRIFQHRSVMEEDVHFKRVKTPRGFLYGRKVIGMRFTFTASGD